MIRVAVLAVLIALLAAGRAGADTPCSITWDGGAGTTAWGAPANWSPDRLPASGDTVCIGATATVVHSTGSDTVQSLRSDGTLTLSAGTLELSDASRAATFTQSGGILSGAGRLDLTATATWSGGQMTGAGTTAVASGATLSQTSGVTLAGGRVLEVAGTYRLTADQSLARGVTPDPLLHVLPGGVLTKTAGTGNGFINAPVEDDGAVTAAGGALLLSGGGPAAGGSFGAGVELRTGAFTLDDGATLAGARLTGATVTIPEGATVSASAGGMTAGTLGGAGTLAIGGAFAWSGGTMRDAGTTTVPSGGTLTLTGLGTLAEGRALEDRGLVRLAGDVSVNRSGTAEPSVHVAAGGVLRKDQGTGSSSLAPALRNDGTVESTSGKLMLQRAAGQPHTGTFHGAARTDLVVFATGTHVLAAGARLTGFTQVIGAQVQLAADVPLAAGDDLLMTSGTLTGPGTLAAGPGTFELGSAFLPGPGRVTVGAAGRLLMNGTCNAQVSSGFALDNAGTMQVSAASRLNLSGTGTRLANSGRLELGAASSGPCTSGAGAIIGSVVNTGTIDKVAGAGEAQVSGLDNDGSVVVSAGGLRLEPLAGARQDGGFAATAPGASLVLDSGTLALGPAATLAGDLRVTGAAVEPAGTIALGPADRLTLDHGSIGGDGTLSIGGTLTWTGGEMTGTGTTVLEPAATATIGDAVLDARRLVNRGAATLAGTLTGRHGASVLNAGTFTLTGNARISGAGYAALFHNAGMLSRTGAGDAAVEWALDNDGTVAASGGTLRLPALLNLGDDGVLAGGTLAAHGATIALAAPVRTLGGRVLLDGAGALIGTAQTDALSTLRRIGGNGALELRGGRSQPVAGPLLDGGALTVGPGSTLAVAGAYRQTSPAVTDLALDGRLTATAFTADPGSLLRTRLAPTAAAPLQVSGAATLAGALDLVTTTPPAAGDLPLLTAASVSGAFAPVTGGYQVVAGPTDVHIHVAAPSIQPLAAPAPARAAGPPRKGVLRRRVSSRARGPRNRRGRTASAGRSR